MLTAPTPAAPAHPKRPAYDRSLAHRLGLRFCAKRHRLSPAEIEHREMLEVITGSSDSVAFLASEFPDLYSLAKFGSEKGFRALEYCPGVSYATIGKLEAWLESVGRVGVGLAVQVLEQLHRGITPETDPLHVRGRLEHALAQLSEKPATQSESRPGTD